MLMNYAEELRHTLISMDSDEEAAWAEEEEAIEAEEAAQAALLAEAEETARKRARVEVDFRPPPPFIFSFDLSSN